MDDKVGNFARTIESLPVQAKYQQFPKHPVQKMLQEVT